MRYKTANVLCNVLCVFGVAAAGFLYSFMDVNAGFVIVAILAFLLIFAGITIKLLFYRCTSCHGLLPFRAIISPDYCPNCGARLDL